MRRFFVQTSISGLVVLAGCRPAERSDGQFHVACSILPLFALTSFIVGDEPGVSVELLLEPGVGCPHDYSLTTGDMKRLSKADLIITTGLGLETFLKPQMLGNAAVAPVGTAVSVISELSQHSGADHVADGHSPESANRHHGDDAACNPHVWMSPAESAKLVRAIGEALGRADAVRKDAYARRAQMCALRLETMAAEVARSATKLDHSAIAASAEVFDYLIRDLSLNVVASIETHESEGSSPRGLARSIAAIRESKARAVFVEAGADQRLERLLQREVRAPVVTLDPLTRSDTWPLPPDWYFDRMRGNLDQISRSLGGGTE